MPTACINFTDVNFAQASAEGFQNQLGLSHGRVYLAGMPDVETKTGVGKLRK